MSDLATMRSNAQYWDKLTDNQKHRLAGADHVKSAEGRANAACRLLLRFGPDMIQRDGILCRQFDNCFEAGDGQRVVALIVRRCQDDPELTRLVRQLSGGSWLDDPRYQPHATAPQTELF